MKARSSAKVNHPDLKGRSYSGYLTVNKTTNSNLFFWFFEAQTNPRNSSIGLWLQGGPGYSGLFGIFMENGPYIFDKNSILKQRNQTWTKFMNIIYIDSPVGTGFSYTDSDSVYARYQCDIVANLMPAIDQFFQLFPEYKKNKFYLMGESYGAKYAISVGTAIHERNQQHGQQEINFYGLMIESGVIDPAALNLALYAKQASLIDSNGYETLLNYQNIGSDLLQQGEYTDAFYLGTVPLLDAFYTLSGLTQEFDYLADVVPLSPALTPFLERDDIRAAIHVGNNTLENILGTNTVYFYLIDDLLRSVSDELPTLLANYRTLIYSGQLDIIAAPPSVETVLETLNYGNYTAATRSPWFDATGVLIGWTKIAENLSRATVRNAGNFFFLNWRIESSREVRNFNCFTGHLIPHDQPEVCFELVRRFMLELPIND